MKTIISPAQFQYKSCSTVRPDGFGVAFPAAIISPYAHPVSFSPITCLKKALLYAISGNCLSMKTARRRRLIRTIHLVARQVIPADCHASDIPEHAFGNDGVFTVYHLADTLNINH